jgi:hypothetical protein
MVACHWSFPAILAIPALTALFMEKGKMRIRFYRPFPFEVSPFTANLLPFI